MKKILSLLLLLSATYSFGQTEQGSVLLGGGLSLRTGENTSQFSFNPTVGYFFADNFTFGGELSFSSNKQGNVRNTSFGIGPFARYYFGKTTTKPFVVSELNFVSTTSKAPSVPDIKSNGTNFLFGLGFAAFINETVAVEGVSGYNYAKFKGASGNGGFSLRFGFGLYFNRNSARDLKTNVLGN